MKELEGLGGMALLEEVLYLGWALRFQNPMPGPVSLSLFLLPVDQDKELSATSPAPCVPAACPVPCQDDYGLNRWNYKPALIKCFPFEQLLWSCCLFTAIESD